MREKFEEIARRLAERASKGRRLEYSEGAVGITSLLYCPKKWELRQKFPELQADSLEIEDGYLFEREFKAVLKEMFGEAFVEEKVLPVEVGGLKIEGHLDAFIELPDRVVGIELKHTKMTFVTERFPYTTENCPKVVFDDSKAVYLPKHYLLQAGIQAAVLKELYPEKEVEQYLFVKTLLKLNGRFKKAYVVRRVEPVEREVLEELVEKFKTDPSPRYPWECSYCVFKEQGACPGKEWKGEERESSLTDEARELLARYYKLSEELKEVKGLLKKEITGRVEWAGKTIGWVEKKRQSWEPKKTAEALRNAGLPVEEFFSPDWRKYRVLEKALREKGIDPDQEGLREIKKVREFSV